MRGVDLLLAGALLALYGSILHAGLRPYDFRRPNRIDWKNDQRGIGFGGDAVVRTLHGWSWRADSEPAELSIETWVVPDRIVEADGGILLGLFDERDPPPLLIAQWKSALYLRVRNQGDRFRNRPKGYRDLQFVHALEPGRELFLALTSGPGGTRLYTDAEPARDGRSSIPLVEPGERLAGRIYLGAMQDLGRGWYGRIRGLALYRTALTQAQIAEHAQSVARGGIARLAGAPGIAALYDFTRVPADRIQSSIPGAPVFRVPALFRPDAPRFLGFHESDLGLRQDLVLNVCAFVPYGFLLFVALRRWRAATRGGALRWVIASAGSTSLALELVQAFLPFRVSSLTDLFTNVAGALLGAALAIAWAARRPHRESSAAGRGGEA